METVSIEKIEAQGIKALRMTIRIESSGDTLSILLPLRAVGKLMSMLEKQGSLKGYEGAIIIDGDQVTVKEQIEKEIV